MDLLTEDSMVEVRRLKPGFDGAWYAAKILKSYTNCRPPKFLVEYLIYNLPYNPPFTEVVDISIIRPLPPPPSPGQIYHLHDVVEAFSANGWWKGVVIEVHKFRRRYIVLLENPPQQLKCSPKQLRVPLIWSHDDVFWVPPPPPPPKQELAITADCMKVGSSPNQHQAGSDYRMEESSMKRERQFTTRVAAADVRAAIFARQKKEKRGGRKEAYQEEEEESAHVSLKDSTTVQVTDSATAQCSTIITSENGIAESSGKRQRGLNAQVTVQHVPSSAAAEDKTNEDPAEVINAVNGQAESQLVRNGDLPFRKSFNLWKDIDSLEIFQILPQKPHFNFLSDCNEETREGSAIGLMLTFVSVVEKVTKLQIDDPTSLFDRYLEALAILEEIGFDVKVVINRVNELLNLKRKREQLDSRLKTYQRSIAECDVKKEKLEQEIAAIDKMRMSGLEEQRALKVSQTVKEDSNRDYLQLELSSLNDVMFEVEHKFKVKSSGPWRTRV